ncbi:hypothetical protein ABBQ32_006070 [Trebouxia sp. C0010 RCD-2024]
MALLVSGNDTIKVSVDKLTEVSEAQQQLNDASDAPCGIPPCRHTRMLLCVVARLVWQSFLPWSLLTSSQFTLIVDALANDRYLYAKVQTLYQVSNAISMTTVDDLSTKQVEQLHQEVVGH